MAASTSQTVDVPVLFRGWMEALCSGEGLSEKEAQQAVTLIAEGAGEPIDCALSMTSRPVPPPPPQHPQ